MPARRLLALLVAVLIGISAPPAKADERAYIELLVQYYSDYYDVPVELVRRVVQRESSFNPRARNGPYWGLMQILPATARTMGFTGQPQDLLDPETNLIYGVKYLRGAYIVAEGDHDRAVQHYARGYYYAARDRGLLEETGLRPGPLSPVAPTPPTQTAAATPPPASPARIPAFDTPVAAAAAPAQAVVAPQAPPVIALGFLPPQRPASLAPAPADNAALAAIDAAEAAPASATEAGRGAATPEISPTAGGDVSLRPSQDLLESTFAALAATGDGQPPSLLP